MWKIRSSAGNAGPKGINKPRSVWESSLPSLLIFGPVFAVNGLRGVSGSHIQSTIGAVMLSLGLAGLYIKQTLLEARLDELERLKN